MIRKQIFMYLRNKKLEKRYPIMDKIIQFFSHLKWRNLLSYDRGDRQLKFSEAI